MNDAVLTAIRTIVGLLVDGSYDVAEAMTRSRRLSAEAMQAAVEAYGATLVMAPAEAFGALDAVQVAGSCPAVLLINVDLWTKEDGQSDLTLELRLTDLYEGAYDIEVLDLHVL